MREYVVSGVPRVLLQDGWWFDPPRNVDGRGSDPARRIGWLLAGLVLLADVLFWRQAGPGLSLALFLGAVAAAVRSGCGAAARRDRGAALLVFLALLPLVERVQALSVAIAALAVMVYAVWLQEGAVRGVLAGVAAVLLRLPRGRLWLCAPLWQRGVGRRAR